MPASAELDALGVDAVELAAAVELMSSLPDATASQAVRFLRATKGDVASAKTFLAQHLTWRENTLPISLESASPELFRLKFTPLGRMPDGSYVMLIRSRLLGKHTYDSMDEAKQGVLYILEHLEQHVLAPLEKVVVLFSRIDSSRENFDLPWIKAMGGLLQANYPERLKCVVVAPVPFIMRGVWETVKPFLDPVTRDKVSLHADAAGAFLDIVPAHLLPEELGGQSTVPLSIDEWIHPPTAAAPHHAQH